MNSPEADYQIAFLIFNGQREKYVLVKPRSYNSVGLVRL